MTELVNPINYKHMLTVIIRQFECFTDANGPEVFKRCAAGWALPTYENGKLQYSTHRNGELRNIQGHGGCSFL